MSRYIDYDAIDYRNARLHDKSEEFLNGVIYMAQRIEDAPSIDIVRCKECKYAHMTYGGDCKYCDMWKDDDDGCIELYLDGDFYCGYGEVRDE